MQPIVFQAAIACPMKPSGYVAKVFGTMEAEIGKEAPFCVDISVSSDETGKSWQWSADCWIDGRFGPALSEVNDLELQIAQHAGEGFIAWMNGADGPLASLVELVDGDTMKKFCDED